MRVLVRYGANLGARKKMREWLSKNEIFFKITSSIFISIAAFVVSLASLAISREQLKIYKVNSEPVFSVSLPQAKNQETGFYDSQFAVIENTGAPAHNLLFKSRTFLEVKMGSESIFLPTGGYFTTQNSKGSLTGVLTIFSGYLNNKLYHDLFLWLLERSNKIYSNPSATKEEAISVIARSLFEIRYKTRYGTEGADYFLDDSEISEQEYRRIVKRDMEPIAFEFGKDEVDNFLDKLGEYQKFEQACTNGDRAHKLYSLCKPN